jgi:hypothetical protein
MSDYQIHQLGSSQKVIVLFNSCVLGTSWTASFWLSIGRTEIFLFSTMSRIVLGLTKLLS